MERTNLYFTMNVAGQMFPRPRTRRVRFGAFLQYFSRAFLEHHHSFGDGTSGQKRPYRIRRLFAASLTRCTRTGCTGGGVRGERIHVTVLGHFSTFLSSNRIHLAMRTTRIGIFGYVFGSVAIILRHRRIRLIFRRHRIGTLGR